MVAAQGQRGVVPVLRARLAAGVLLRSYCLLSSGWCVPQRVFWRFGMCSRSSTAAQLEEKRIPYTIEKINMGCYGDKPPEYTRKARAAAACGLVDARHAWGSPALRLLPNAQLCSRPNMQRCVWCSRTCFGLSAHNTTWTPRECSCCTLSAWGHPLQLHRCTALCR